MARNLTPKCRQCRREGEKLFLKGEKCFSDKCAIERRNYPPGQHGQKKSRQSDYAVQLREKQKIRRIYGLLERQFRRAYHQADRHKGVTGENLLQILESRLDNVAFNMGFGASRAESRQVVKHNAILVNGVKVNIPSFQVSPGDKIQVADHAKNHLRIKASTEIAKRRNYPVWMDVDSQNLSGIYKSRPDRSDLSSTINESLVVELYSK
ncbi:MAG TPA: 30S ribosomal protein S4 [Nitrosomonas sp.]|uniref:Small ribosomal subunit protein uS4 n=1 Tax=Nitrosomonas mobilis TaxID=51642 RepID=A0A1G5SDJ8_9PROT|nr:30S ribosomal protein S4 [Nitrosomonas mobilis]SCZ85212.1 30S ribosomal subunit protein S4 [Nitrosomonas mobilis]HBV20574.1 30S ribosomal protein S4 [Nitrosomonas sp.]